MSRFLNSCRCAGAQIVISFSAPPQILIMMTCLSLLTHEYAIVAGTRLDTRVGLSLASQMVNSLLVSGVGSRSCGLAPA